MTIINNKNDIIKLVGRKRDLLDADILSNSQEMNEKISNGRFLIIGGAGTIGQAVAYEIFKKNPLALHIVDISENNLVELVRDLRSSIGYIKGDFKTFAIDSGSIEFDALMRSEINYDYVLNLSALKHVRSEEDPFTLMRMINVNIVNTLTSIKWAKELNAKKYFCVSTDKATAPINMMGASKRIMEKFLMQQSDNLLVSTSRFANVAFSDGSLLHGFNQRIKKSQPLVAPSDTYRYFITPKEAGQLCLMSCLLGKNRDNFFPSSDEELNLISFSRIAQDYLKLLGFSAFVCDTEKEARENVNRLKKEGKWPCYFFKSDTTGEKTEETFFLPEDEIDMSRFKNIGVIKNKKTESTDSLNFFLAEIEKMKISQKWFKSDILDLFNNIVPEFKHLETGLYLDSKM